MNKCANPLCRKDTLNPKYCSKACSAKVNNKKFPKRFKKGICICGKTISSARVYCKGCFKKYRRTIHPRKEAYKYVKSNRTRNKMRAIELLGGKCAICGYNKSIRSLQFHHLNPKKKSFTISANMSKAWKLIEAELKKCVLLCANCHGEVEAGITKLVV